MFVKYVNDPVRVWVWRVARDCAMIAREPHDLTAAGCLGSRLMTLRVWVIKRRTRASASSLTLKRARWCTSAISVIRSTPAQVLYEITKRLPTPLDPMIFVQSVGRLLREQINYGDIFKQLTDSVKMSYL